MATRRSEASDLAQDQPVAPAKILSPGNNQPSGDPHKRKLPSVLLSVVVCSVMFVASPDKDIERVAKECRGIPPINLDGLKNYPIRAILFASLATGSAPEQYSHRVLNALQGGPPGGPANHPSYYVYAQFLTLSVIQTVCNDYACWAGSTPTRIKGQTAPGGSRRGAAARKCGVTGARWA